ncbi:MAG: hypothetical protein HSCHL_1652 [Hydrogenibacillus schlegelii]|uniref:Uncharacterized protein n=1 Tax=Hydrogenibacillus schlegelii TaxID=1484 RepID=A0A2T5GBM0_HYDSH|nr:MAG: hypothetical protein HSCHL_1652 [Hydrogenibacillus schlegelii]
MRLTADGRRRGAGRPAGSRGAKAQCRRRPKRRRRDDRLRRSLFTPVSVESAFSRKTPFVSHRNESASRVPTERLPAIYEKTSNHLRKSPGRRIIVKEA